MKPYPTNESAVDATKRLFNKRLSGCRTVKPLSLMLENVYGRWKKSFLSIKKLRMKLESSQKTIVVTAILYNISRLWGEEEDNKDDESDDSSDESECDDDGGSVNGNNVTVRDEARDTIRIRGQVERDRMKDSMPLR